MLLDFVLLLTLLFTVVKKVYLFVLPMCVCVCINIQYVTDANRKTIFIKMSICWFVINIMLKS